MDNKRVYVILGEHYPVELARKEIEEEQYPFTFLFMRDTEVLKNADEVWIFGNPVGEGAYLKHFAEMIGKQIWVMG